MKLTKEQEEFMRYHCMDLGPSEREMAEMEEYHRTPHRSNRPMEDWDRYKELSQNPK